MLGLGLLRTALRSPALARGMSKAAKRRVERKLKNREWIQNAKARAHLAVPTRTLPMITRSSTAEQVAALSRMPAGSMLVRDKLAKSVAKGNEPLRSLIVGAVLRLPINYACDKIASGVLSDCLVRAATPAELEPALEELAAHSMRLAWHRSASEVLCVALSELPADTAAAFASEVARHLLPQMPSIGKDTCGASVLAAILSASRPQIAELVAAPVAREATSFALDGGLGLVCAALRPRADGTRLRAGELAETQLANDVDRLLAEAEKGLDIITTLAGAAAPRGGLARALAAGLTPRATQIARTEEGAYAIEAVLHVAPPVEASLLALRIAHSADELIYHSEGARAVGAIFSTPALVEQSNGAEAIDLATVSGFLALDGGFAVEDAYVPPMLWRPEDTQPGRRTPTPEELMVPDSRPGVIPMCTARALRLLFTYGSPTVCTRAHATLVPRLPALALDHAGAVLLDGLLSAEQLPAETAAELLRAIAPHSQTLALDARGCIVLRAALRHAQASPHMDATVVWLRANEPRLGKHQVAARLYAD
ncbi:hypothetical protein T492DRAFT_949010 [Pavlovales sp. CCMP2436]|nr:hypothetical protein T492DRAFT_949010 [Pavlovales sp. CCMP2436]